MSIFPWGDVLGSVLDLVLEPVLGSVLDPVLGPVLDPVLSPVLGSILAPKSPPLLHRRPYWPFVERKHLLTPGCPPSFPYFFVAVPCAQPILLTPFGSDLASQLLRPQGRWHVFRGAKRGVPEN